MAFWQLCVCVCVLCMCVCRCKCVHMCVHVYRCQLCIADGFVVQYERLLFAGYQAGEGVDGRYVLEAPPSFPLH